MRSALRPAPTLFYCDPPYHGTEGYGVEFTMDECQRMASLARTIKGKMLISVNDIPGMRVIFAALNTDTLSSGKALHPA